MGSPGTPTPEGQMVVRRRGIGRGRPVTHRHAAGGHGRQPHPAPPSCSSSSTPCCVVAGFGLAEVAYFRDRAPAHYWQHFAEFLAVAVVVTLMSNRLFGLYGRMWRHAGSEEARQLVALGRRPSSASSSPSGRSDGRSTSSSSRRSSSSSDACSPRRGRGSSDSTRACSPGSAGRKRMGLRVAVIGSRDTGAAAIREMLRSPGAGLVPVAVFDDDPRAHGLSVIGVPVVGTIADIPEAASRYTIQQVLLAIPSPVPSSSSGPCWPPRRAGVSMKILPGVQDMLNEPAHVAATPPGPRAPHRGPARAAPRSPRTSSRCAARSTGHRVLVTGAGGSIGSEICRQVSSLEPGRCWSCSTTTRPTSTTRRPPWAARCTQALVDITDRDAVLEAFDRYRPEVVFHAAAHKHVPVLEEHPVGRGQHQRARHPERGRRGGRRRAPRGSCRSPPTRPCAPRASWVPRSAWRSRRSLAHAPEGAAYSTVRFGNVLGSRGSVIPTFARQIAQGGPVTVTDPRMTRFFMSVEEAVQLVLQASRAVQGRRDLHAGDGSARPDPRPGRAHDPAVRLPGGHRHPDRDHRRSGPGRSSTRC